MRNSGIELSCIATVNAIAPGIEYLYNKPVVTLPTSHAWRSPAPPSSSLPTSRHQAARATVGPFHRPGVSTPPYGLSGADAGSWSCITSRWARTRKGVLQWTLSRRGNRARVFVRRVLLDARHRATHRQASLE